MRIRASCFVALTSLSALHIFLSAAGAEVTLAHRTPVTPPGGQFLQPRWSPDGTKLAFSSPKYGDIWVSDDRGNGLAKLLTEPGAGFRFAWAPDGGSIACRAKQPGGLRLLRVDTTGKTLGSSASQADLAVPQVSGDRVVCAAGGKPFALSLRSASESAAGPAPEGAVFVRDGAVIVYQNGVEKQLSGAGDTAFLPLPSPDGRWVVFETLGSGLQLANVVSGQLISIGRGNNAAWSPDSASLVYDISEDDGKNITAADLYLFDVKTAAKTRLTATPDRIERNPSWSPDGKRLAWDEGGRIFTGELTPGAGGRP